MIDIVGKRNSAIVYADKIDDETKRNIAIILRDKAYADSKIRIMPDTHASRNSVVGLTMTLNRRVCPSLIGVDIGCGMECVFIREKDVDLQKLDEVIHNFIPSGAKIHQSPVADFNLKGLRCAGRVSLNRAMLSIGTLGGGNHFIELDKSNDYLVLVIHSGSRILGSEVATYYLNQAYKQLIKKNRKVVNIKEYSWRSDSEYNTRSTKREAKTDMKANKNTAVLEGQLFDDYLHDIEIVQNYAEFNRRTMADIICREMGFTIEDRFSCVHNYIDVEHMILRKGAISARQDERVIIPLNMRDGAILARGLGNPDWNFSAPHGAGRACTRTDARYAYTVEEFVNEMQGIYTTTANLGSLDECPMAYKSPDRIIPLIGDTVAIEEIIKPIYNFKAC